MLDHVSLQADDLGAATAFYEAVLAPLGYRLLFDETDAKGFGDAFPAFWIGRATDVGARREAHVAFQAPDRAAVHAFRDAAVATGAEVLHEPRVFPEYHPGYYGAFVRDPDGNNVEAVHHTFES